MLCVYVLMISAMALGAAHGSRADVEQRSRNRAEILGPQNYPVYQTSPNYVNPLSDSGKRAEQSAVGLVTTASFQKFVTDVTNVNDGDVQTRSSMNGAATQQTAKFVSDQLAEMGYTVCIEKFSVSNRRGKFRSFNVFAYIEGSKKPRDSVTVGAHSDSIPKRGTAPGAVDNGSGTASMLTIAKAFKDAGVVPEKSVYFAAFGGEEQGLHGSKAFVSELKRGQPNIDVKCKLPKKSFLQRSGKHSSITMDMVGWKSPRWEKPTVTLETFDWSKDVADHLQASNIDNHVGLQTLWNDEPYASDHESFLKAGMHSVLAIQGDDGAYPCYHKSCDTIENVNFDLGASISKMNLGALIRMAGA